jgi:hypothetical protein
MREGSYVDQHKVFVVGDSIFAAGIAQTLTDSGAAHVVGTGSSIGAAMPRLRENSLDALIVAGTRDTLADCGDLLTTYPNLTIIRADLEIDKVQVISSRCVKARFSDLLAVIEALPHRK